MVVGFFWVLSTLLSSTPFVEELLRQEVSGISFLRPANWVPIEDEEEGGIRFETPEGDAFVKIGVAVLRPTKSPRDCVDEMIENMKQHYQEWERISVDGHPAARWVGTKRGSKEEIPSAEERERLALGQEVDTRETSILVLGCNGARLWVLGMSAKTRDAAKYGPTFRRVRESLQYVKRTTPGGRAPAKRN